MPGSELQTTPDNPADSIDHNNNEIELETPAHDSPDQTESNSRDADQSINVSGNDQTSGTTPNDSNTELSVNTESSKNVNTTV